VLKQTTRFR